MQFLHLDIGEWARAHPVFPGQISLFQIAPVDLEIAASTTGTCPKPKSNKRKPGHELFRLVFARAWAPTEPQFLSVQEQIRILFPCMNSEGVEICRWPKRRDSKSDFLLRESDLMRVHALHTTRSISYIQTLNATSLKALDKLRVLVLLELLDVECSTVCDGRAFCSQFFWISIAIGLSIMTLLMSHAAFSF